MTTIYDNISKNRERINILLNGVSSTSLFKNFISLFINSFLASILGFVFLTITARILSAADVGIYSTIISVVGLLGLLSRFGLDVGLVRFLPQSKDPNCLINSCFIIGAFTSAILSMIFISCADYFVPSLSDIFSQTIFAFCFIVIVILSVLIGFQMNIFVSRRSTKYLILRDSTNNALKIVLVITLAVFSMQISAIDLFYIHGISLLVSIYLGYILLKKVTKNYLVIFELDFQQIKTMMKFSSSMYVSSLIGTGSQLALPLLVLNILGAENAAYFYITWTMRNFIELIPGSISTSLFAEGANNPKDLYSNAKKSVAISYLFLIPVIIAITIIGSAILSIFGEDYAQNCYHTLVLFALSVLFSSVNQIIYNIKLVNTSHRFILLYTGCSGLGLLFFSSIFMSYLGLIGIGLSLIVSQGVILIFILVILLVQRQKR
jgi:O-antigen/teichoic acid export membrane protein